jgi:DNA-binding NtrC family response regulator
MKKILVIEDDEAIRSNILDLLEAEGFEGVGAGDGEKGLDAAMEHRPDVIICDVMMPKLDGYGVLKQLHARPELATTPFIFLTAKAERADQRNGMNLGADDYITKPFENSELLDAINTRLKRIEELAQSFAEQNQGPPPSSRRAPRPASTSRPSRKVVIHSENMKELYEEATQAAQAPLSVLVLGETGTGKDVLAREIHRRSPRRDAPFVALNCAALSPSLVESELFGHAKGAYTSADQAQPGPFEVAHGGTIFLDEIGELAPAIQVKLLRVLEERMVRRVGEREEREVDVRFIAATNIDIEREIENGGFRQDLFFRLNGITLEIPALRERRAEVVPLAEQFAEMACRVLARPTVTIREDTVALLERYQWPGNVRELKNAVDRAVALCRGNEIEARHLPAKLRGNGAAAPEAARDGAPPTPSHQVQEGIAEAERQAMRDALAQCGGNATRAAKLLDWSRRKFVERMGRFGISGPRKKR